ncbi:MAG: 50S ribosomal protein L3 [Acidobacteria bacterium]|nr:50S ribosomal protein L3 [Acidobacteriota bacterium]MSO61951.1 50S ribosomal protein L3 [Acidobacteriota bacterium]
MVTGIIGKKVGMTQLFLEDGTLEPATVIQAGPCIVVQSKSGQIDGYDAVQLGLVEDKPIRNANKALTGHHKKANVPPTRVQREVKIAKGAEAPKPGDQVLVSIFNQGERVDVIGTSKGHGFQGVVKRHHFAGGPGGHGSMFHRAPGSIGASSYPSRVMPGMRAHGHMGTDRITVRNLKVLKIDSENNLLLVKGAIPGANGGYVVIRKAVAAKPEPQPQLQEKPKKGKK